MSFLRPLSLLLSLILALVAPARAWTSKGTPEAEALQGVRGRIEVFELEKKRLPESWKELDEFSGKPMDQSYPLVLPTRRYELFFPPPELRLYGRSAQAIAITRKPMWETTREGNMGRTLALKGPGRYVLHRPPDGDWRVEWFPESAIQRLWPSTGRALPVPDQEPERSWVTAARWQIFMKRLGIGAGVVLVGVWFVARLRGKRKTDTSPLPN